jgi:hypothetical protein
LVLWDSQTLSGHGTNLKPVYRVEFRNEVVMGAPLEALHGMPVVMLRRGVVNASPLKHQPIRRRREAFEFLMPSCMLGLIFRF